MAELTPERLAELRRIAEAATPGPWEWNKYLHLFSATGKPVLTKPFSPDNPDVVEAMPEDLDYIERFNPETVLALLDRIEALEAFVWAEHAIREHASTCFYWGWKPGACPNGVCGQLKAQREEAYRRALEAMGIKDSYKPLNYWEEG